MDSIAARWVALTLRRSRLLLTARLYWPRLFYGQLGLGREVGGASFFPSAAQILVILFLSIGLPRCAEHEWLSLLMDSVCHSPLRFDPLGHEHSGQVDSHITFILKVKSQLLLSSILPPLVDLQWVCY